MSKDKRYTLSQVQKLMNTSYDNLESISLQSTREVLISEFNFTEDQWEKFKDLYLDKFGENSANYVTNTRRLLSGKIKL